MVRNACRCFELLVFLMMVPGLPVTLLIMHALMERWDPIGS